MHGLKIPLDNLPSCSDIDSLGHDIRCHKNLIQNAKIWPLIEFSIPISIIMKNISLEIDKI